MNPDGRAGVNLVPAVLLLAGAVAAGWPVRTARQRLRTAGASPGDRLSSLVGAIATAATERPRRFQSGAAALAAAPAFLLGGPVAALVGAAYAWVGARVWLRRTGRQRVAAGRRAALDGLCALVADLRAGLPPAVAQPSAVSGDARLSELTAAVWRLADGTGAPAADLLERIEADARAADRAVAKAAAQAAGAQATAALLAGLPAGGIALGASIGADPLHVLFATPLGAVCAVTAVLLQCGGLAWAQRLAEGGRR